MNKELSPLEALERIGKLKVEGLRVVPTKTIVKDYADFEIIETALKRLEDLEKWFLDDKDYKNYKALEIIKEYFWIEDFQDFVAFNGRLPKSLKDKYELLKEVLL